MKTKIIYCVLIICVFIPRFSEAQRNSFHYGDKIGQDLNKSLQIIENEISDFENKIESLDKESEKLYSRFEKSDSPNFRSSLSKRIIANDSLTIVYREKLSKMEDYRIEFIKKAAGKDKTAVISSKNSNPAKLRAAADAYSTLVYTDAYVKNMGHNEEISNLSGIVLNHWFRDVHVIVTGPANLYKEFYLKGNGGKAIFPLTVPGYYTAVFKYNNETRVVRKRVTPGLNRGAYIEGETYDFSAMLYRN